MFFTLYRLFYMPWLIDNLHPKIINVNAFLPYGFIKILGEPVSFMQSKTIVSPNFSLDVIIDCCAIEPSILFFSAVMAYPVAVRKKLRILLIVIPLFFTINIIRIISLYYIGAYISFHIMERMHLDIWQGIFILIAIGVFVLWLKNTSKQKTVCNQ
ncbi:MAG: archaeosortase/exosortase family protein [Bacteroidales bacterium]|nr:archaeosortase/exosortase family protein [Bacteroidales bacterium]